MRRSEIDAAVAEARRQMPKVPASDVHVLNTIRDLAGGALYGSFNQYEATKVALVDIIARATAHLERLEEPGRVVEDPLSKTWTRVTN